MLIVNSGKCGDNLTWTYDEKQKLLDIDGSGPMLFDSIPWEEWKDEVETVFLHECSFICAGAFRGFKNLRDVTVFDEELKEIGPSAFEDCVSLKSIYFFGRAELQKVSDCAFRNCTCLKSWDANVAVVGSRAFENCINLDFRGYAVGTEEIGAYAFANCKSMSQPFPYLSTVRLMDCEILGSDGSSSNALAKLWYCIAINEACLLGPFRWYIFTFAEATVTAHGVLSPSL